MYTFLFGLIVTVSSGLLASFLVNLFVNYSYKYSKNRNAHKELTSHEYVEKNFIIYDLFKVFKRKRRVNNAEELIMLKKTGKPSLKKNRNFSKNKIVDLLKKNKKSQH